MTEKKETERAQCSQCGGARMVGTIGSMRTCELCDGKGSTAPGCEKCRGACFFGTEGHPPDSGDFTKEELELLRLACLDEVRANRALLGSMPPMPISVKTVLTEKLRENEAEYVSLIKRIQEMLRGKP